MRYLGFPVEPYLGFCAESWLPLVAAGVRGGQGPRPPSRPLRSPAFRANNGGSGGPGGSGGRNEARDFRGEPRTNDMHASTTDPEAKLHRKSASTTAKRAYIGHAVSENRHGLIVAAQVTQASGTAERGAAIEMLGELSGPRRCTLAADKGYPTECRMVSRRHDMARHSQWCELYDTSYATFSAAAGQLRCCGLEPTRARIQETAKFWCFGAGSTYRSRALEDVLAGFPARTGSRGGRPRP